MDSLSVLGKDAAFAMPQFTDIMDGVDKADIPADQLAQIERNWVVVEDATGSPCWSTTSYYSRWLLRQPM